MSDAPGSETQDVVDPLAIARALIAAGVPVFAAPPCPGAGGGGQCSRPGHQSGKEEYDLPPKWQLTVPSEVWLERWQPGWALAAVGGHAADFLDEDPRNGGDASITELTAQRQMPNVYGVATTPSGGRHYLIAPLREPKGTPLPGLDYQGGAPDGRGRGFVWIAPTVKRSKIDGEPRPYVWAQPPDLDWLGEFDQSAGDGTGDAVVARLHSLRHTSATPPPHLRHTSATKEFTEADARAFCDITLSRLMKADVGQIEEAANAAAAQLSHFVPDFWSAEFAYAALTAALGATAYDPEHPASRWEASKFEPVLRGEGDRAPGDWRAVRKPEISEPAPDAVDALLAEMLSPAQVAARPSPRELVKGLLTLDSESWLIGAPGSRKSFVALDLAGHVARGLIWQGLKTLQARVVMIVAEGAGGISRRVQAWEKTHGAMGDQVFILPRPVQAADLDAWQVLVEACRRLAPGLVVLDTQARVTVGLEENSAKEMGVYIDALSAIRQATGACVLTVHHTGRKGGDARGSSAIDGAQSTELKVEASDGLRGRLLVEKQKDLEERQPLPLLFDRIVLGLDEDGEEVTSLVLAADPLRVLEIGAAGEAAARVPHRLSEPLALWGEFTHVSAYRQREVFQVLYELASGGGLTKAEVRTVVWERWGRNGQDNADFGKAWDRARKAVLPAGHEYVGECAGENVMVDAGGQRWQLHSALRSLED